MPPITNQLLYQLSYVGREQNPATSAKFRPPGSQRRPNGDAPKPGRNKPHSPIQEELNGREVRFGRRSGRKTSGLRRYAPRSGSLLDRLNFFIQRAGPDECWPWSGFRDKQGYGRITFNKKRFIAAHRAALEAVVGPLPAGAIVMHSCDNPPCCNPAHLSAGTRAENNADAKAKGRHAHGVTNGCAKLGVPEVIAIRLRYADGEKAVRLAKEYGVSDRQIANIAHGEKWAHVGGPISARRKLRVSRG